MLPVVRAVGTWTAYECSALASGVAFSAWKAGGRAIGAVATECREMSFSLHSYIQKYSLTIPYADQKRSLSIHPGAEPTTPATTMQVSHMRAESGPSARTDIVAT